TAIHHGSLSITTARGSHFHCGDGSGVPLKVRFLTERAAPRLVLDPELAFGELYMDGDLLIEQGSIADLIALLFDQPEAAAPYWAKPPAAVRRLVRHVRAFHPRPR